MEKRILFLIPDERKVYADIGIKVGAFHLPSLAFGVLGAIAKRRGFEPAILDLTLCPDGDLALRERLAALQPVYVGITCTSATYWQAVVLARSVKAACPSARTLIGGPHASSTVEETLEKGCFDYLFIGEAEVSFAKFLDGDDPHLIPGVAFKTPAGAIHRSPPQPFLRNLDDFPLPDYGLYDLSRYHVSRLQARRNPVVWLETSRGPPSTARSATRWFMAVPSGPSRRRGSWRSSSTAWRWELARSISLTTASPRTSRARSKSATG